MTRSGNTLITSAAAKVLLVQAFMAAARERGGKVFTADIAPIYPAAHFGDGALPVVRTDDPAALDCFLRLARENDIGLIVPTRDGELGFFARHKQAFAAAGVTVLVPHEAQLEECQDKRRFSERLARIGLAGIPEIKPGEAIRLPVFARPVRGAGGRGAGRIDTPAQLAAVAPRETFMLHQLIVAPEYSIDLLMGLEPGRALQAVVRERIDVVAGESKVSKVVDHPALERATLALGTALGLVGHNTVQAFDDPVHGPLFIEVNPRFGGASNLGIVAGLDSPARILDLLAGDPSAQTPRAVRIGLTMYRYSQDLFV